MSSDKAGMFSLLGNPNVLEPVPRGNPRELTSSSELIGMYLEAKTLTGIPPRMV
jgi:hypothetical protein